MKQTPKDIQNIYVGLTLVNTLAASLIWGVNTLFLLDAGLTNTEAFAANAFFTLGQVIFEVPTGIVADTWGRRFSYLLGTLSLALSTLLYLYAWQIHGPFWMWAATSIFLGLGFTFFSGATEAWLVDALDATGYKGTLESVFAKGQITGGIAMLVGSVGGGMIAQFTNLGVPYILRASILGINFIAAFIYMRDLGFSPLKSKHPLTHIKKTLTTSIELGLKNPPVRWMMLAAPFASGVGIYTFYAMQPYLLKLYGDPNAYGIAGLAAAIVAGAQIAGGFLVPYLAKVFKRRTSVIMSGVALSSLILLYIGFVTNFYLALFFLIVWALISAALTPVRQAYMNGLIPSAERATVLSFDNLIASSGGIFVQPILGRVADAVGYSTSYIGGAAFQIMSFPFVWLARKQKPKSDIIA